MKKSVLSKGLFYAKPSERLSKEEMIASYLTHLEQEKGSRLSQQERAAADELCEKQIQDSRAEQEALERLMS